MLFGVTDSMYEWNGIDFLESLSRWRREMSKFLTGGGTPLHRPTGKISHFTIPLNTINTNGLRHYIKNQKVPG